MRALLSTFVLLAAFAAFAQAPQARNGQGTSLAPPKHEPAGGQSVEELLPDLQRLFKPMKAPVLADVEGAWFTIGGWSLPEPVTIGSLQTLASYIDREAMPVNGAWVFHRTGDPNSKSPSRLALAKWLLSDTGDLKALMDGNVSLYRLPAEGQRMLRRSACDVGGLGTKMMNGEAVKVKLAYSFSVRYKDPQTGMEQEFVAPEDPPKPPALDVPIPSTLEEAQKIAQEKAEEDARQAAEEERLYGDPNRDPGSAIKPVNDGAYDAGEGKLMKLEDLLKEVGKAFGKTYFVDGRFRQNRVFIRGKFTPDRFIAALRCMTTAEPSIAIEGDAASRRADLDNALNQLWDALADADTSGSAAAELKQKLKNGVVSMTAGEMAAISRLLKPDFKRLGLGPDTPVSVHRDMILYVGARGSSNGTSNVSPFGLAPQH